MPLPQMRNTDLGNEEDRRDEREIWCTVFGQFNLRYLLEIQWTYSVM